MSLQHSQAAESNKLPILKVLKKLLTDSQTVLEIGSGTAQHAVFFAKEMPHLTWQCADQLIYHDAINQRLAETALTNILPPVKLETETFDWKGVYADSIFSANTAHIMSWNAVESMFRGVGQVLASGSAAGLFILYGPFNRDGAFTSESNRQFDQMLKRREPKMGIRDDQALISLALQHGLRFIQDIEMPSNNRILVWDRI